MIEYVALGDYGTAVGFLLASTPDKSARYYRDALCTLALAVSHEQSCAACGGTNRWSEAVCSHHVNVHGKQSNCVLIVWQFARCPDRAIRILQTSALSHAKAASALTNSGIVC